MTLDQRCPNCGRWGLENLGDDATEDYGWQCHFCYAMQMPAWRPPDTSHHVGRTTYLVTVQIDAPDDRIGLRAANEVAEHIRYHFRLRHDALDITCGDPQRVPEIVPENDVNRRGIPFTREGE